MRIEVNGEARELEEGTTVGGLVRQLAHAPERLAVELNREVLRRARWEETALADGDKIEVVHFVGGGSGGLTRERANLSPRFAEPRHGAKRINIRN